MNKFTDHRDGQTYKTVELAGKTWLAENLNYDIGYGCYYYEKKSGLFGLGKKEIIKGQGKLYTWDAALRACPDGWKIPSDKDWKELIDFLGIENNNKAYEILRVGGSSGLDVLLAGWRPTGGRFYNLGITAYFWTSTDEEDGAFNYEFGPYGGSYYRYFVYKTAAYSVRCIKI